MRVEVRNMLCDPCTSAFEEFAPRRTRILHGTFASLEYGLKIHCGFCHRIVYALSSKERHSRPILSGLQLCAGMDPGSFRLEINFRDGTGGGQFFLGSIAIFAKISGKELKETCHITLTISHEQEHLPEIALLEADNGTTSSSMNTLSSWIGECQLNHSRCRREGMSTSNARFARILDVRDGIVSPDVTLQPREQLPSNLKYMTLSHCWGESPQHTPSLTTTNYSEFLQRIGFEMLPKTFQDAIQLTRRLRIRYLWIDSLCIVQDSREDWLSQAEIMGEIYQNSHLNIAATKSSNPNGGLFTTRDPVLMTPLRVVIPGQISTDTLMRDHNPKPSLRLLGETLLISSSIEPPKDAVETQVSLNTLLGNRNGSFDSRGRNFVSSARSVRLLGTILHAELATVQGEWTSDSIELKGLLGEISDHSSLRLLSAETLLVSSYVVDPKTTAILDLQTCLGNDDGTFDTGGENFAPSAMNVSLVDTTIHAKLRAMNGEWRQSSLDLAKVLSWSNGHLCYRPRCLNHSARKFYNVGRASFETWLEQITRSKLCNRAWVFQERLLAPRVVHFTEQQLVWECAHSQLLEENPTLAIDSRQSWAREFGLDFKNWDLFSDEILQMPKDRDLGLNYVWTSLKAMYGRDHTTFSKEVLSGDTNHLREAKRRCYGEENWSPTHPLIRYWSAFVVPYSGAGITYADDRLIAIAGLAKILSSRTGIAYFAGLWMVQLPRQLLWEFSYASSKTEVKLSRAPTWSWASQLRSLSKRGLQMDPILERKGAMDLIEVLSVDYEDAMGRNSVNFGSVESGLLRVREHLLPLSLDLNAWPEGALRSEHLVQFWTGSMQEVPTGETFLVPVLFTRWNDELPAATPNALLLESTSEKGIFRRIGIARLSSLCPLNHIVTQLYVAQSKHYEDADDDADSEGEAEEKLSEFVPDRSVSSVDQPSSDHFHYEMTRPEGLDMLVGAVGETQKKLTRSAQKFGVDTAIVQTANTLLDVVRHRIAADRLQRPSRSREKNLSDARTTDQRTAGSSLPDQMRDDPGGRKHEWVQRDIPKLKPKYAVADHFYLEYIEDDDDVGRYGHFVFAIC